jgi:hypothetical protein
MEISHHLQSLPSTHKKKSELKDLAMPAESSHACGDTPHGDILLVEKEEWKFTLGVNALVQDVTY